MQKRTFKNKWSLDIKGPTSLIKALTEELEKIGYVVYRTITDPVQMTSYNDNTSSLGFFRQWARNDKNGCKESPYFKALELPRDWDLALKLAAETIVLKVPSYVEIIKDDDCFKKGEILKTEQLKNDQWRFVWPDDSGQIYSSEYEGYFKPSTKAAYEAQFLSQPVPGKWYKYVKAPLLLVYSQEVSETCIERGYGFDIYGNWKENTSWLTGAFKNKEVMEATPQEVEEALITEAKKRGYKNGVKVHSFVHKKPLIINYSDNHDKTTYHIEYNKLHFGIDEHLCVVVFEKGEWAKIIPKETVVNGYPVTKFDEEKVKVGCKVFYVSELKQIYAFLDGYGGFYTYESIAWTKSDIEEVIKTFNNA